nr:hypothetical protein [Tanacetum cinerariifolium]
MDQQMNEAVQVKEQVKVQVSKILPRIKQTVNEQLEAKVLTRSSNSSKTSYAVVADLFEMELKKILIEKMEGNKSIHRSKEQRNLYKALVEAYESDKIILDTYRETVTLKRRHDDDADKDEEPSAGPDQGSKRRREGKEPESASAPTKTATRSAGRSELGIEAEGELGFIVGGELSKLEGGELSKLEEAGSRDRPPMLAKRRYAQWQSRFLRYIVTRPNGNGLRKCILEAVETLLTMSPENKAHYESEKEAIHLLLTGIRYEIYSTVDACKTAHDMWIAIVGYNKEFSHFAKECMKPKWVKDFTYHKENEKGVPLQAEQCDWLADTDEEIDEQEVEAHYSFMEKI